MRTSRMKTENKLQRRREKQTELNDDGRIKRPHTACFSRTNQHCFLETYAHLIPDSSNRYNPPHSQKIQSLNLIQINPILHAHTNESLRKYWYNETHEFNSYRGETRTTTTRDREEKKEREGKGREEEERRRKGRKRRERERAEEEREEKWRLIEAAFCLGEKHHSNHLWARIQMFVRAAERWRREKEVEENCTKG